MDKQHPDFAPHYAELAAGRLSFPWCEDCQRFHWYPMPRCPHCRSEHVAWRAVRPQGELYSWTEIHHAFDARYSGPLPYIVALIEFADAPGVRLIGNLVDARAETLACGLRVEADFTRVADGDGAFVFRPRAQSAP